VAAVVTSASINVVAGIDFWNQKPGRVIVEPKPYGEYLNPAVRSMI
jgi:hypothetical protein